MKSKGYINDEDKCPIFPRKDHPDERTAKEFFIALNNKLFVKRIEQKMKAESNNPYKKMVKCLNTGTIYESIRHAERELGIKNNLVKHLKGHPRYSHVKGFKFTYL